jgi:amino acid permease
LRSLLILKITLGEMVSLLPLPGSFFALATRTLSPSLVVSPTPFAEF